MENFVLYIIVGLVACSNFACAGEWHEACPLEAQTIKTMMTSTEGWEKHIPTCWTDFRDIFWEEDWKCAKDFWSNLKKCKESFTGENMKESVQKCIAADWSCSKKCHERAVELYGKIKWDELKTCWEQFMKASKEMHEKYWDNLWNGMKDFEPSDTCMNSIKEKVKEESKKAASHHGFCN